MTEFNYARSNSLLRQENEDNLDENDIPSQISPSNAAASQKISASVVNGAAAATFDSASAKHASTKKTIPAKKSKLAKHKLTHGDTTITAAPNQDKGSSEMETAENALQNGSGNPAAPKAKKARVRKPRRVIPNEKEFIPANEQPTQTDVVGGRGGRSNHHPGNRPYWIRILESRTEYTRSRSDHEKARIATGILRYVQQDLKGRFLNIDNKTKRWYILPNSVVLDKIKQALRDKYIPYWARDLKIESKTSATGAAPGTNLPMQNIDNKLPPMALNSLNTMFGPSYGGLRNANLPDPSVTLAAIKAASQRANATALGLAGAAAAKAAATAGVSTTPPRANNTNTNKPKNKLDFLFGAAARRPPQLGPTASIPTVDDILKVKVDQMPSFGGVGVSNAGIMAAAMANASVPPIPSIGLNPFQPRLPPALMSSLGLGGLPGPRSLLNEAANHGFGAGGNPGAPALPSMGYGLPPSMGVPPSIGVLQSLNMKSLDNFMEEKMKGAIPPSMGGQPFGATAAALSSLGMMSALAGTSFDSAVSHAPSPGLGASFPPAATSSNGSKKTDWNAMYTKALTNSKG